MFRNQTICDVVRYFWLDCLISIIIKNSLCFASLCTFTQYCTASPLRSILWCPQDSRLKWFSSMFHRFINIIFIWRRHFPESVTEEALSSCIFPQFPPYQRNIMIETRRWFDKSLKLKLFQSLFQRILLKYPVLVW